VQRVPEVLPPELKRSGREIDHTLSFFHNFQEVWFINKQVQRAVPFLEGLKNYNTFLIYEFMGCNVK
jgi:hypothetical protein